MTKGRAFAIHLTASISVMLAVLGMMWLVWYPPPYFEIGGGWGVIGILAGVDVVLGPSLTLIVFKPGKPSLKLDMSVIVALQLAALAYGGWVIEQARPAFSVFAVDRFTAVPAGEVAFDQLAYPELKRWMHTGPLLVEATPPEDPEARRTLLFDVVMKGAKDLEYRAELYHPYRPDLERLSQRSLDVASLAANDTTARDKLDDFLEGHGGKLTDFFYLPLLGRNKDVVFVLSRKDGQPVGWIDLDPWRKPQPKVGSLQAEATKTPEDARD